MFFGINASATAEPQDKREKTVRTRGSTCTLQNQTSHHNNYLARVRYNSVITPSLESTPHQPTLHNPPCGIFDGTNEVRLFSVITVIREDRHERLQSCTARFRSVSVHNNRNYIPIAAQNKLILEAQGSFFIFIFITRRLRERNSKVDTR